MTVQVKVAIRKRPRTIKQPTVDWVLGKAKRMLAKAKVVPEAETLYVIYICGHVFDNVDDPQIVTYYIGENRGIRSCPICNNQKLFTKYKRCGCGTEHVGKRTQASKYCGKCPPIRKSTGRSYTLTEHLKNSDQADLSRIYCTHRSDCLSEHWAYDALPCKNCEKYEMAKPEKDGASTRR